MFEEDIDNLQLSVLDEDTQQLLESDDDESKVVARYDTGDPQFLDKAYNDMRKLDFLLQERFSVEDSLRRKRRRHLKTIHQTLSELQVKSGARHAGQHEQENTRKFMSATELQSILPDIVQSALPEEEICSQTDSTIETPITDSQSESTMSIPKRINFDELEDLEKKWALIPFDNYDNDDEVTDSLENDDSEQQLPDNSQEKTKPSKNSKYYSPSFRFDSQPPQVDHVKRNILCGGYFHTPEERKRLDELLNEVDNQSSISEDEEAFSNAIRPAYTVNPFTLFGEEYKVLQDLDEQLSAVRIAQKALNDPTRKGPPSSSFNSTTVEHLHFGFQKSEREACDEARRRFEEINTRLGEIESAENLMLERILEHAEPVEPVESQENIQEVLTMAEKDLLAITYDSSGRANVAADFNKAVVPFVSEKQLNLLLGPFPRCSHFEELDKKQWHGESFEQWKAWLEDRQVSLDRIHQELQDDRKRIQDGFENGEFISVEEMERRFSELMNDLKNVKDELDDLILSEHNKVLESKVLTNGYLVSPINC